MTAPMNTHADAATDTLRTAATTATRSVTEAVRQAQEARAEVALSGDIVQAMGAVASLILACEAMQEAGKRAEAELRAKLASVMGETGATTVRTDHHTVSLKSGAQRVVVQSGAVPAEFLVQPPPKPDLKAIGEHLRKSGTAVNWAVLASGEPTVQIRTREAA